MQIRALTPDEIVTQLGAEPPDLDSDLCRQVREALTMDMSEGQNCGWRCVVQPVDEEPFYIELRGLGHVCELVHDREAVEICFVIPCMGAIEHSDSEKLKDLPDYHSISPTMQFLKELNSSNYTEEEKDQQLRESWLQDGFVLFHCFPHRGGCWLWVEEHKQFVFGGQDAPTKPGSGFGQNPFFTVLETKLEIILEGRSKWDFQEETVKRYEAQKQEEQENIWKHQEISWNSANLMLGNIEWVVRELVYGFSASAEFADALAAKESYRRYRDAIMGGISMFSDLLADREAFNVCMGKLTTKGRERAWTSITERHAHVSQLMREVDEKHAKKSGANN